MNQLNVKIALAPILAIVLVLLLAGAISSIIPSNDKIIPNAGTPPTQATQSLSGNSPILPFFYICLVIIVGLVVALLFFREKGLAKALGE